MFRQLMTKALAALMALAMILSLCPVMEAQASGGTHTIMFYMPGCALEERYGIMTDEVYEIMNSGVDLSKVNVCLCLGGAEKWTEFNTAYGAVRMFKLVDNGGSVGLEEIEKAKTRDMSNYATLKTFINACVAKCPADTYSLMFVGMGGSALYGCVMDSAKYTIMNVSDIAKGIKGSKLAKQKLEWIGFDASLMASAEACAQLQNYANYMLASQETMPGRGFDYSFLGELDLTGNTETVLQEICDHYMLTWLGDETCDITLSVLDLSKANAVVSALDSIFQTKKGPFSFPDDVYKISGSVAKAKSFGNWCTDVTYNLYDMITFAEAISEYAPSQGAALKSALESMIVYNTPMVDGANGVSFYYPLYVMGAESDCNKLFKSTLSTQGYSKNYATFLATYIKQHTKAVKDYEVPQVEVVAQADGNYTCTLEIPSSLKGHFVYGQFVVLKKHEVQSNADSDAKEKKSKKQKNTTNNRTRYYLIREGTTLAADENGNLTVDIPGVVAALRTSDSQSWFETTLEEREVLEDGTVRAFIPLRVSPNGEMHSVGGYLQVTYNGNESAASYGVVPTNIRYQSAKNIVELSVGDYVEFHEKVVMDNIRTTTTKKAVTVNYVPYSEWTESQAYLKASNALRIGKSGIQVNLLPFDDTAEYYVQMTWFDEFGHEYNSQVTLLK